MEEFQEYINKAFLEIHEKNPGFYYTGMTTRMEKDGSMTVIIEGMKPATEEDIVNEAEVTYFDAIVDKTSHEVKFSGPPKECELWLFRRAFTPILDQIMVAVGETKSYISPEDYIKEKKKEGGK